MGNIFSWWGNNSSTSNDSRFTKIEQEISNLKKSISAKVDKVSGKSLSTNDFTDDYKGKVDSASNDIAKINDAIEKINENGTAIPVNNDNQSIQEKDVDYVTPQMFGAKGDGWTDDTEAVQAAIDSGKSVFFPFGDYLVSKPIIITDKKFWTLHAEDAIIEYTGEDYAVKVLNARNCRINISTIYTKTGGGIEFYSDSEDSWNQYVTFTFDFIMAKTDCIHAENAGEGWCNENQVYGGHFVSGENGVHFTRKNGVHGLNGWKFYNCGVEGVKNGFLFDAGDGEICNNVIVNPRYAESFETALITKGTVYDCKWIAPTPIMPSYIKASPETTRFIIDAPIGTYWHMHDTAFVRGCIMDGKLMGERPEYVSVE